MLREWELPEHEPGEANDSWCRRAAAAVPADALVRALLRWAKKNGSRPVWGIVSDATGHGSRVSIAIVKRFMGDSTE